ncbi:MAG: glycosyltransferase family 2 protein [Anaerolineae bacterium]|nr:glycosyltransferase family 2 protein [Anaerolineae bacterium]
MDLSVVILNWNAAEETIRCARAVSAWEHVHATPWIVDNDSADDSAELIARELPEAHLICSIENLGYGGGNNQGIAQAMSAGDAPILLLNNDAYIDEQHVVRLLCALRADERLGFVGPLLYGSDAGGLLSAGGRDISRHVNSHIQGIRGDGPIRETAYVPGTVALIRSAVFREVGLFDTDYFFSGEMADLCERARQHGYASAIDTRARAYHAQHDSSDLRDTLYAYYSLRNRFLFVQKFRPSQQVLLHGLWTLYGLGASLKARLLNKVARARALHLAVSDGLRGRFGGQNERILSVGSVPDSSGSTGQ